MDWKQILIETLKNIWEAKEYYYPIIGMYAFGIYIKIKNKLKN